MTQTSLGVRLLLCIYRTISLCTIRERSSFNQFPFKALQYIRSVRVLQIPPTPHLIAGSLLPLGGAMWLSKLCPPTDLMQPIRLELARHVFLIIDKTNQLKSDCWNPLKCSSLAAFCDTRRALIQVAKPSAFDQAMEELVC